MPGRRNHGNKVGGIEWMAFYEGGLEKISCTGLMAREIKRWESCSELVLLYELEMSDMRRSCIICQKTIFGECLV